MGISTRKLATALRAARHSVAASSLCPHGSYRVYDCSPTGVVMPERITPAEHSEVGGLFAGACICDGCRNDRRSAASQLPPVLYHATPEKNVESVLRSGLTVPEPDYRPGPDGIHRNRVFLSRFDDPAYMNLPADRIADAVVLAVDTSYLDPARLYPDDSLYAAYFNDQLSEEELAAMFPAFHDEWRRRGGKGDFGEWMDENGPDDELESLLAGRYGLTLWGSSPVHELGEVGYEASIPPEAISVHGKKASAPARAARRILAAAGREFWQMTRREFMHPKFDVRALDRIAKGKEGDQAGILGDYFRGEKIRELYAPVLDIPVMVISGPIEGGKRVKMPEGYEFKGALGTFRGEMTIFLPGGTINGLIKALLEEGAHAMRESKGRESPKTSMENFDWDAYEALPHEQSAAVMSEHALSLKEKNHRDFVEEALAAGETVSPEVLADYPELAPDAVAHTAAAGLTALGETIPYDGELYHGTTLGGAASIARGGFQAQSHGEMSAETVSLTRNTVAAEIFASREGVVFEFDIRLDRLFVVPEFVGDVMSCYAGLGLCDEEAIGRIAENADALKRIGALPESWDPESGEMPDWSEWREGDMNEYDWLEKSLPGYDGVVVPGFHSTHPRAEAEIAVFDSVARRLMDSVVMMSVAGRIYSTEGGEGESIEDGWNALGAVDPGEHGMGLDAALHRAAVEVGDAAGYGATDTMWHGTTADALRGIEKDGFLRAPVYLTDRRQNAQGFAEMAADSVGLPSEAAIVLKVVLPEGVRERLVPDMEFAGQSGNFILEENVPLEWVPWYPNPDDISPPALREAAQKPLVLYHGTTETEIGQLEAGPGKHQRVAGIYLSKSRVEAEKYTKTDGVKHPENVLTIHAYLRNPATREVLDELGYKLDGDQMQAELIRRGYDSVIDELMDEVIVFDPGKLTIVNDDPQEVMANSLAQARVALTESWPSSADGGWIRDHIVQRHYPDFEDFDRIGEMYELRNVPLASIHAPWDTDEETAREYAGMGMEDMPPIVLDTDMTIVDGGHRFAAATRMGEETIPAYVEVEPETRGPVAASDSPPGGWSDHWDQGDLRDAVVYAAESYGDEWGWKWDPESVERQMDEVALVGFREMDPREYTDISALGPLGDPGWMKDEPPDDWSDLLEYEYDRPFAHIVEAWLASRLSPAVFFEGVGEGDGRARALFSYALDMPLRTAIFRYEGRRGVRATALRRAACRIASVGTIVAYHATRAGSAIMQEGFKKSTEVSGGGLGGSSHQGSVSFTTDWEVAKGIHDAFALMHSLVNAADPMEAVGRHFKSLEPGMRDGMLKLLEGSFGSEVEMTMQGWRFKYDAFNAMTEDELQEKGFRPKDDATFEKGGKTLHYGWYEPMEREEKEKVVYNYVNAYGYSESSKYNPVFMGGDSKHFKGIPKSDIGIVTVELNIDPSKKMEHHGESGEGYAILPAESEYRVTDMSMIGRILDYDSDPGDEPKVQALEKSYHADDETEEWVNKLLMVFQRNRKALDGFGISVRQMISNLRNADDMHAVRRLADAALKAIGMDRMDLSLKSLMRLKDLSKPSEIASKAMDSMPPEVLRRVERSDDFVQVTEWWADHDEEAYMQWVDRMYGMGINESSAEFEIDEWIRSRYHAKRFQEELASLSRFADGLNEENLDNFAEVSRVLYEVVDTNPYLRASAALRRARLQVSAVASGYTIQADSEGDHIWAFVFDADGEQVDDAYADVRVGDATDFQDMPGGSYDFFGQDEPIEEEGRVAVLTGLELPEELRGSGLGRQMVEAVTGMAFSAGAQAVYTHAVGGRSLDPTGFYERVGFEKVDMDSSGHYYLRLGPPRTAVVDRGYAVRADREGNNIRASVFDEDGDPMEEAYADVRLGTAGTIRGLEDLYDYFGEDKPIKEGARIAVLTWLELPEMLKGAGLGRQLVAAATGLAFEAGAQAVYTHAVDIAGSDPTGFYERLGFEKVHKDSSGEYYLQLWPPRSAAAPTIEQIATEARRRLVGDYDLDDETPKALCMEFAEYLTERLKEAGYDAKLVRGTFYLDYPDPMDTDEWDPDDFEGGEEEMETAKQNAVHYWVEVDGNTVVDIAADQFDDECDEQFEPVTVGSYAELGRYTP